MANLGGDEVTWARRWLTVRCREVGKDAIS